MRTSADWRQRVRLGGNLIGQWSARFFRQSASRLMTARLMMFFVLHAKCMGGKVKKKKDRRLKDRRWHLLRSAKRVGLAVPWFESLVASEPNHCAICDRTGNLVNDHCHKRKRHRGRLCSACNTALGLMEDDITRLQYAIEYLQAFEERWRYADSYEEAYEEDGPDYSDEVNLTDTNTQKRGAR